MLEHGVAADTVVWLAGGKGITGTGGGQGLKTEMGEQARGARVPGIGDDECCIALVERAKDAGFFGLRGHDASLHCTRSRLWPERQQDGAALWFAARC